MRKFKLIKEYPQSPLKDTVVIKSIFGNYVVEEIPLLVFDRAAIELYPEYWEEVEEFPKIISFKRVPNPSISCYLKWWVGENGKIQNSEFTVKEFLEDSRYEIYQVAVSETEIFTLGDKVKHPFTDGFDVISKFIICKDPKRDVVGAIDRPDLIGKLVANVGNCFGNCNIEVSKLEKAPEVLFVTEDGVEILDLNENVVCINTCDVVSNYKPWNTLFKNIDLKHNNFKLFKSLEKAEQWVKYNKPRFSVKDIEEALLISKEGIPINMSDEGFIILSNFNEKQFKQKLGI